jgi:hypothetical protein
MLNRNSLHQPFRWGNWVDLKYVEKIISKSNDTSWPFTWYGKNPADILSFPPLIPATENQQTFTAKVYLSELAPIPSKVIFLGESKSNIAVYSEEEYNERLEKSSFPNYEEKFVHLPPVTSLLSSGVALQDKIAIDISEDAWRLNLTDLMNVDDDSTDEQHHHAKLIRQAINEPLTAPKYFFEVPLVNDPFILGVHYDWRFFNKLRRGKEHEKFMHHLIRAWSKFTEQEGLLSFIAHGSLLGWYWNGIAMPWDADNDVQMPIQEFDRFARRYNQSLIVEDSNEGEGRYFIDINPYYPDRSRGNGNNVIDARFIDIRSGIYLDITALAKNVGEKNQVNCKNYHYYSVNSLTPARRSLYEGTPVYVPNDFEVVLLSEYGGARKPNFSNWMFDRDLKLWVPNFKCESYKQRQKKFTQSKELTCYGACENNEIWHEYNLTQRVTDIHSMEMDLYSKLMELDDRIKATRSPATQKVAANNVSVQPQKYRGRPDASGQKIDEHEEHQGKIEEQKGEQPEIQQTQPTASEQPKQEETWQGSQQAALTSPSSTFTTVIPSPTSELPELNPEVLFALEEEKQQIYQRFADLLRPYIKPLRDDPK